MIGFTLLAASVNLNAQSISDKDSSSARPTVYAWFPARFGSWRTDSLQWDCLTHLCFRSVELTAEGKLRRVSGNPPKDFVDTAHRHGVKVTVLVWTRSRADSDGYLAHAPQQAASNLLAYVRENNLDGVNLDDEQMGATNTVARAPNRELVTRFFQVLAKTLKATNPQYHLSFAAPPVIAPDDRFATSWLDLKAIAEVVDAIIPMGYTQNPPSIGWTTNPEPLGGGGKAAWTTTRDMQTVVRDYLQAMGGHKQKLLLGVSLNFGGYEWRCRTDERLSSTLGKGVWRSLSDCEAAVRQHGLRWDDAQQSAWYCYRDGDAFVQGWFNGAKAWTAKLRWVKEQDLGGIGIWVLDGVTDPPDRWQVLRAAFGDRLGPTRKPFGIAAQPVTLVEEGIPQMTLLPGSVPEPVAELQRYLKRISGTELPVGRSQPGAHGVFVGLASDFPWLLVTNVAQLGGEGFILKSDGTNLFLLAHEALGVQQAVTTFLHALGCRWYFPGPTWEVVPRRRTLTGAWDQRSVPSFPMQRKIWYGFGTYRPCEQEFDVWERHNRMGGPVTISIGHTSHGLDFKTDFEQHPDWFALVGGQRKPTKPCYSHPAVVERAIRYALAQAGSGATMISMTPPDGLGYCECDRCFAVFQGAKPYAAYGSFFAKRPDGVVVNVTSETLFHFINQVAAAVAEKFPATWIGCYAYSAYSHPPSFPLHAKVFVQTTTAFRRTGLTQEEQLDGWSARTAQTGIRDYYSVYQWDWDYPSAGKLAPATLQKELQFFHRKGVTSLNAEASNNWGPRGLGYYLAVQLLWDVNADVPSLLQDFYEQAFGPAARVMERYYVRWYGRSAAVFPPERGTTTSDTPRSVPQFATARDELQNDQATVPFSIDTLKASFRDLDEAARLVRDLPECRARVDQLRMYWHYLYLRHRLDEAAQSGNSDAIRQAIQAELTFGGRLAYLNVIHARPLLGKALLRRFKQFEPLLVNQPEVQREGQGWREVGAPPSPEELERLWQLDTTALAVSSTP